MWCIKLGFVSRFVLNTVLICYALFCESQPTFNKRFNYTNATLGGSLLIKSNSIVVTGNTFYNDGANYVVMFCSEFSFNGDILDEQIIGGSAVEFFPMASSSILLSEDNFIQSCVGGADDIAHATLIWFDANNDPIDTMYYLSPYNPDGLDIVNDAIRPEEISLDPLGNIYLSCDIFDQATTGNDFVIFKISPTGEMLWQYIYATESSVDWCHTIVHDGEGLVVAAYRSENFGDNLNTKHFFRLLEDANDSPIVDPNFDFIQDFPSAGNPRHIILEPTGIVVASERINESQTGLGPLLYKIDFGGNILWQSQQVIDWYEDNQEYSRVIATEDGGYLCVGSEHLQGDNLEGWESDVDWNGILVKHSNVGEVQWIRRYKYIESCKEEHFIYDLKATPDGGYVFCGESRDGCSDANWTAETPRQQGWVVKVDACGCLVPGCDENCVVGVDEFVLENKAFKVGPNPTTQFLNIYLAQDAIPSANNQFQLFDAKGMLIKQFVAQKGGTTYSLDVDKYASGTYILSLLKEGIVVQTEKVVIE